MPKIINEALQNSEERLVRGLGTENIHLTQFSSLMKFAVITEHQAQLFLASAFGGIFKEKIIIKLQAHPIIVGQVEHSFSH